MRGLTPCLLGLLSLLMISCGGGSGGSKTTKTRTAAAVFSVEWPEASRFIHNRATKVKLVVFRGDTLAISGQGETARPGNGTTSQIKLNELPADESLKIAASAEDASGRVLSSAIQYSTLKPGANALTFTLASVVTTVEITPGSPTVAVGGTLNLSAVGKNGTATVLSDTSDFDWSSSAPLVATVDSTGKVVGIADGTATITVREAGNDATGLTATIQIKVGSGETVNYQITDLGTLGGDNCFATALTNDGQVVGYSDTSSQSHVFLWSGGSMTDLSYLGYNSQGYGLDVTSVAVNKFGRVVASFYDSQAVHG